VRQNHYPRKGKTDGNRLDRPAESRRQCAGARGKRAHMQRVARRKGIVTLAGKRNPMQVPEDGSAVRPHLIEHGLQSMRYQTGRDSDEQSVVTGAPQRVASSA
jgi:hypothetical protein